MSKSLSHKCDKCGNVYTRIFTLKNHRRTHFDEKPFRCRTCYLSFTRDHDRKAHEREVHDKRRKFFCEGTRDSSFTHAPCGRLFSRHTSMTRHLKTVKTKSLQASNIGPDGAESDGPADPPVISFISPCLGSIAGGERIVVTGTSFSKGLTVFFGEVEATAITFLSRKHLTCETPACLEPGLVAVTLKGKQLIDGSGRSEAFSFEPVFWYLEGQDMETHQIEGAEKQELHQHSAPAGRKKSLRDPTSTLESTDIMVLDKEGAVVGTGPEMNAADILLNLTTETLGNDPPPQAETDLSSKTSATPSSRQSQITSSGSNADLYISFFVQGGNTTLLGPRYTVSLRRSVDGANFYSRPSQQDFARYWLNGKAMMRLMANSNYGTPTSMELLQLLAHLGTRIFHLMIGEDVCLVGDLERACRKVSQLLQSTEGPSSTCELKIASWIETLDRRLNEALAQMTKGQG